MGISMVTFINPDVDYVLAKVRLKSSEAEINRFVSRGGTFCELRYAITWYTGFKGYARRVLEKSWWTLWFLIEEIVVRKRKKLSTLTVLLVIILCCKSLLAGLWFHPTSSLKKYFRIASPREWDGCCADKVWLSFFGRRYIYLKTLMPWEGLW